MRAPPRPLEDCDRGAIESALAAPAAQYEGQQAYPDLPSKAAALTYALAKSQACTDGNKRIALILLVEFLAINGADLDELSEETSTQMILSAAASDPADRDNVRLELAVWFESHIVGAS